MRFRLLICVGIALTAAEVSSSPVLVWNASSSVPIGLYRIEAGRPQLNDLVLVDLPADAARLANHRGYLHRTNYVVKPVAAVDGDGVCRLGNAILVNERLAAVANGHDGAGRPMPSWQGCYRLARGEVLLLSDPPDSFDSRYFGPIASSELVGRAHLLWAYTKAYH